MKRIVSVLCAVLLVTSVAAMAHDKPAKRSLEDKQAGIDQMADESLERLFEASPNAAEQFDAAMGYAVFRNTKVGLAFTGGGGVGVAVNKETGERTYMKMGTAGFGLSLGAQVYDVIFLFENPATFQHFLESGWEAETQANLAAWKDGANASTSFIRGKAFYQLTRTGVMASADIAGSKYWVSKRLN